MSRYEEIKNKSSYDYTDIPFLINIIEKLINPINTLKQNLSDEGDYSISRTDKKPMQLYEVMMIDLVFEKIDKAIVFIEQESK